jgi:hypothetical protein
MATSILSGVTSGRTQTGIRIVIAAQEKMGKTTLCSGAPSPLLIPLEVGFAGVTVNKTGMLQSWEEVQQLMGEIYTMCQARQFAFKTLIFDSGTALERYIHDAIIRRDPAYRPGSKKIITMESAHGGYGKAYNLANEEFDSFLQWADVMAVHFGINIVITCHVFSSKVMDPTSGEYDSWDLLLHSPKNNKTYGKRERITQWADIVGFLYEPVFVSKTDNMVRAVSQNKGRVLGLSRTPGYNAGNRFGVVGEYPIPGPPANGWNALAQAIYQSPLGQGIDIFTR